MRVEMNVDMDDFSQSCSAMISRVSRGTRVAAQEGGAAILLAAQARCPIYTGTLRNSGRLSVTGSSANDYREGFSAEITFGAGEKVNPLTKQHPSEYAAAVHEGFAINPLTGEMSDYKSGEPKFLEKAIREFEHTGLQKLAYKHWGAALGYYTATQQVMAEARALQRTGQGPLGGEHLEVTRNVGTRAQYKTSIVGTELKAKEFFSDGKVGLQRREMTRIFMGVNKDTPGVTDSNLFMHYLKNQREITKANLYAQGFGVERASEATKALADAFMFGGVYDIKGSAKLSKQQLATASQRAVERDREAYENFMAGDEW